MILFLLSERTIFYDVAKKFLEYNRIAKKQRWMKNPKLAMISCNDGFRPVSFLLETMDEEV